MKHIISTLLVCASFTGAMAQDKMNPTQVIGSHNSYKSGIEKPLMDIIIADRQKR